MKIFLSYPSEETGLAESIRHALVAHGHKVFLDLKPGRNYDGRIRASIRGCELFIFLLSPQSVTKGRYTLTELKFARDRWRNPSKRVLAVVVRSVRHADIPPYLRAVTWLEPEGNAVAEVLDAVERLRPSRWLPALEWGFAVGVFGGVVFGVVEWLWPI